MDGAFKDRTGYNDASALVLCRTDFRIQLCYFREGLLSTYEPFHVSHSRRCSIDILRFDPFLYMW